MVVGRSKSLWLEEIVFEKEKKTKKQEFHGFPFLAYRTKISKSPIEWRHTPWHHSMGNKMRSKGSFKRW
jgi:hypothetical protein